MTNSHLVANIHTNTRGHMDTYIVLNICALTDFYFSKVCTKDCVIKYRRIIADTHIANQASAFGQKDPFAHLRYFAFILN